MTVILFLAVLVALVIVHELGHFAVAKLFRMRVDEFGVGFPPRLASLWRGETEYSLNLLPFGGFVRIFGEDPAAEVMGPDAERSFARGTKIAQASVLIAGVAANVLFAWLLFSVGFIAGMPTAAHDTRFGAPADVRLAVTGVLPDSPAARAGLRSGDNILALEAGAMTLERPTPESVMSFLGAQELKTATLSIERSGTTMSVHVQPIVGLFPAEPKKVGIGISMGEVGEVVLPPHRALIAGGVLTFSTFKDITLGLGTFFLQALSLSADLSSIAGPVGIATMVGDASALGFVHLLVFAAFISLNLAVINLIPFPALDGGRLLFVGIEAVTRRTVPLRAFRLMNVIGFGLLIALMVVVTYHDIARLVA
jgi:regulator of sigma E protease